MTTEIALTVIASLAVGAIVGWLLGNRKAAVAEGRVKELEKTRDIAAEDFGALKEQLQQVSADKAASEARLEETRKNIEEQKKILDDAKEKLSVAFKAVAADTLSDSNTEFLKLAKESFARLKSDANSSLEAREKAVEALVKPIGESLREFKSATDKLENKRIEDNTSLKDQLATLASTEETLKDRTSSLLNALKNPIIRGRWGQAKLERILELAGLTEHIDFDPQASVQGESGRLIPDVKISMPSGRMLLIDAKFPGDGYFEALEETDAGKKQQALKKHAASLRLHVSELSKKEYWQGFPESPEYVIMFLPYESVYLAALEADPELTETSLTSNVIITSPHTLLGLLRAVERGWRQQRLAESALKLSQLGQELYDRMATLSEFMLDLGRSLGGSVKSYNRLIGSFESRAFSTARKFKELGVGEKKRIEEIEPLEETPRLLNLPDVRQIPSPEEFK